MGTIQVAMDQQFTFGQVRFDPRTGELRRDGSVAKLTPRAAAVLCVLAERRNGSSPQELLDRVWGGRAVGDDALTSCIQELRGASTTTPAGRATSRPIIGAATG
jgi:DNA-binding winged helix-turn-helix (wHTH) protein